MLTKVNLKNAPRPPVLQNVTETDYLQVWHYPEKKLLISRWRRAVDDAEYRHGASLIVDYIEALQINDWLTDSSLLRGLSYDQQQWSQLLVKRISSTGLCRLARVASPDVFHEIAVGKVICAADNTGQLCFYMCEFTTLAEALAWFEVHDTALPLSA